MRIGKRIFRRHHQRLAAAVGMAVLWGLTMPVNAQSSETISSSGRDMFQLYYFDQADETAELAGVNDQPFSIPSARRDLDAYSKACAQGGVQYWADILAPQAQNKAAASIYVMGYTSENADAISYAWINGEYMDGADGALKASLQQGADIVNPDAQGWNKKVDGFTDKTAGLSLINLGENLGLPSEQYPLGWAMGADSVLPSCEAQSDLTAVMRHEIAHALGIGAVITIEQGYALPQAGPATAANSWDMHLMDANGHMAAPGMQLVTSAAAGNIQNEDLFIRDKAYFSGSHVSEVLNGATFDGYDALPLNVDAASHEDIGNQFSHIELQNGLMSHQRYRNYTTMMEAELAVMQDLGYDFDRRNYYGYSIYDSGRTGFVNTHGYTARNSAGTDYLSGIYNTTALGVGLHVYGSNNTITQAADILTQGTGAAGIRLDGTENQLTIADGVQVRADGKNGIGLLTAYGRNQTVNVQGTLTADGEGGRALQFDFGSNMLGLFDYYGSYIQYARETDRTGKISVGTNRDFTAADARPELNGALVDTCTIAGTVSGAEEAIYIGRNAFVKDIQVNAGAAINGHIVSDWKHFGSTDGIYDANPYLDTETITVTETLSCTNSFDALDILDTYDASWTGNKNGKIVGLSIDGKEIAVGSDIQDLFWYDAAYVFTIEKNVEQDVQRQGEALRLQYEGKSYAYGDYIPDLVTNLAINTDLTYGYRIDGPDNMKLNIHAGTFRLEGAGEASVVNATVAAGASAIGGTYTLHDMSGQLADGFTDTTTGQFINHGTIGAATPDTADTDLTINGTLATDGAVQFTANGIYQGKIHVNGAIQDAGTRLTLDPAGTYLPTSYSVLYQNGQLADMAFTNAADVYRSGLLTGAYQDGLLTLQVSNNLPEMSDRQAGAFQALGRLYAGADDRGRNQLGKVYSLDAAGAGQALDAMSGAGMTGAATMVQTSALAAGVVSARLDQARQTEIRSLRIPVSSLVDDDGATGISVNLPVDIDPANGSWLKLGKGWGELGGGAARFHRSSITVGRDVKTAPDTRAGAFLSYDQGSYSASGVSNGMKDWRLGLYGSWESGPRSAFLYMDYGWEQNDMHRSLGAAGQTAGKYSGRLMEIGGEYRYDLQPQRSIHVSPYVSMQASRYRQGAWQESGAGLLNQHVDSYTSSYLAGEAGIEVRRAYAGGSYALRAGYKKVFAGTDPVLRFHYEGDPAQAYTNEGRTDSQFWTAGIRGESRLGSGWSLQGDAALARGAHDKDLTASVTLKRVW